FTKCFETRPEPEAVNTDSMNPCRPCRGKRPSSFFCRSLPRAKESKYCHNTGRPAIIRCPMGYFKGAYPEGKSSGHGNRCCGSAASKGVLQDSKEQNMPRCSQTGVVAELPVGECCRTVMNRTILGVLRPVFWLSYRRTLAAVSVVNTLPPALHTSRQAPPPPPRAGATSHSSATTAPESPKVTALRETVAQLTARCTAIEARFEAIDARFAAIEAGTASIRTAAGRTLDTLVESNQALVATLTTFSEAGQHRRQL
ncbi:hypothetical protein O3P69_013457, partial [Scylla paramamosain]